ncbi:MAG TPA: signal peptidase I [Acidobacteriota bacterium]|nr:signal peptidase I [Acidobacteriota bacterium]
MIEDDNLNRKNEIEAEADSEQVRPLEDPRRPQAEPGIPVPLQAAPAEPAPQQQPKPKRSLLAEVFSWLRDLVVAGIICLVLIIYVAQPFRVEKTSMVPLLSDGDRILVSKISLILEPIRRGDIVVLHNPRNPDESWIKRVIALPGEQVRIDEGIVFVDGEPLGESYIPEEKRLGPKNTYPPEAVVELTKRYEHLMERFGMVIEDNPGHGSYSKVAQRVPEGYYFVMGDNRIYSMDSRDSIYTINDPDHPEEGGPGLIPKGYIYGKAVFRYWPLDKFGPIPTAEYETSEER